MPNPYIPRGDPDTWKLAVILDAQKIDAKFQEGWERSDGFWARHSAEWLAGVRRASQIRRMCGTGSALDPSASASSRPSVDELGREIAERIRNPLRPNRYARAAPVIESMARDLGQSGDEVVREIVAAAMGFGMGLPGLPANLAHANEREILKPYLRLVRWFVGDHFAGLSLGEMPQESRVTEHVRFQYESQSYGKTDALIGKATAVELLAVYRAFLDAAPLTPSERTMLYAQYQLDPDGEHLVYLEPREIADELGLNRGLVRVHLCSGRKKLKPRRTCDKQDLSS